MKAKNLIALLGLGASLALAPNARAASTNFVANADTSIDWVFQTTNYQHVVNQPTHGSITGDLSGTYEHGTELTNNVSVDIGYCLIGFTGLPANAVINNSTQAVYTVDGVYDVSASIGTNLYSMSTTAMAGTNDVTASTHAIVDKDTAYHGETVTSTIDDSVADPKNSRIIYTDPKATITEGP